MYILFTNNNKKINKKKESQEKSQQIQQAVFLCLFIEDTSFKNVGRNMYFIIIYQLLYLIDCNIHSVYPS